MNKSTGGECMRTWFTYGSHTDWASNVMALLLKGKTPSPTKKRTRPRSQTGPNSRRNPSPQRMINGLASHSNSHSNSNSISKIPPVMDPSDQSDSGVGSLGANQYIGPTPGLSMRVSNGQIIGYNKNGADVQRYGDNESV